MVSTPAVELVNARGLDTVLVSGAVSGVPMSVVSVSAVTEEVVGRELAVDGLLCDTGGEYSGAVVAGAGGVDSPPAVEDKEPRTDARD